MMAVHTSNVEGSVSLNDTLLLIEPEHAAAYEAANRPTAVSSSTTTGVSVGTSTGSSSTSSTYTTGSSTTVPAPTAASGVRSFHAMADVSPATAKMRLVQIAEEVIALLCSDPNAEVRVTLEISADFPGGVSDQLKRSANENCTSLGITTKSWE